MNKILTIVDKEWAEVFKNRLVLFTVVLLPLLFTAIPLFILYSMGGTTYGGAVSQMPPEFTRVCGNVTGIACVQVFMMYDFMVLFMILPLAIPVAISAYSIVGEKTTRSLEPLLATPITTAELILGKALAAIVPAMVATWAAFGIFLIGARLLVSNPEVIARLLDPLWLLAVVVLGPLMATAAVNVSIIISSRVSDPRAAEQLSMLLIVPLMGVFLGQMAGLLLIDVNFVLLSIAVVLAADVGLVYLGVGLFQRETILTQWR